VHSFDHVVDGVHESQFLCVIKQGDGFGFGDVARSWWSIMRGKIDTDVCWKLAAPSNVILLFSADTGSDIKYTAGVEEGSHIVIGKNPLGFHRVVRWDHAVQGRLRTHNPFRATRCEILFDEMGITMVYLLQLRFINPDNPW
jgi:hypothetical protein